MNLYSTEDADYLIQYYSDKMIGNLLEESTGSRVIRLFKEDYGNNMYRVNGEGTLIKGVVKPKRSIDLIAITQNLISPDEALRLRNES